MLRETLEDLPNPEQGQGNINHLPQMMDPPGWHEFIRVWSRVAMLSFGGPAGQVSVMHRILVDEKKWIQPESFLHALNYCMLLPGPEAQQLATYIGWKMRGYVGGLVSGLLFIFPGFVSIMVLSLLYGWLGHQPIFVAIFLGLKAAVIAIVFQAVFRIGKRVLHHHSLVIIAALSFSFLLFLRLPFPWILLMAALAGWAVSRIRPTWLGPVASPKDSANVLVSAANTVGIPKTAIEHLRRALAIISICTTLWCLPVVVCGLLFGWDSIFVLQGIFFSETAMVTFGGAYAVLNYVAQRAVEDYHWLTPQEMLDGLGMAETTPGPLIMVLQFVGFIAASRAPTSLDPMLAGILGACLTTWVTFVPCFLWIFLGAPYIEAIQRIQSIAAALKGVTAAVCGVILHLALWFTLHVLFDNVQSQSYWGLYLPCPVWSSLQSDALLLASVAIVLKFWTKLGLPWLLATTILLSLLIYGARCFW